MKICPRCKTERLLTDFPGKKKRSGWCKDCCAIQSRLYYQMNKEKSKEAHKRWVSKNSERVAFHKAKSAYGISREEYDALLNICVICGNKENLRIDHSHQSGRIRGKLCDGCNKGLGFFRDDPTLLLRAADYVFGVAKPDIFEATYEKVSEEKTK